MKKLFLPAALLLAAGCTPSIETKNEVEIKPIEIKPMQIQIDVNVNVRVQKELKDAFGELDAAENKM
ncbi:hypothetical protein SDC9_169438 [bioreactor metagenome]|uniref:YnbE-like lipoprotein n=1 Tax=bioreactor metagenome TaxID=1076179 RepID=A0A645G5X7_9ZZZZ|nr:hypothetical protein [Victivallaceae bacterium]